MRKTIFLALLLSTLLACQDKKVSGVITDYETDSLFLYKVKSESTYDMTFLQSIPVTKNGKFGIDNDSLEIGLYCLSLQYDGREEPVNDYGFLFIEPVPMQITISKRKDHSMNVHASGSPVEESYVDFVEKRLLEENRLVYDSLGNLFDKAYEAGDTIEMSRLKDLSTPYYENAREKLNELVKEQMEKHAGTYFALYLYYLYNFPNEKLNIPDEIANIRAYLNTFDNTARQSDYHREMEEMLDRAQQCAVGCMAPEITGINENGKAIKLSDFRGKFVLVDFWSSSCSWCRLETPHLRSAYEEFKDKGFTILGVSFDHKVADWREAIEEDNSHWDQLLLGKTDMNPTMIKYCISGIPHIILVDPEGIIVSKDLRGTEICEAVKKHLTSRL